MDFNNAFFNGTLQETIYTTQPEKYVSKEHPTFVSKLKKAIYGLKQALRAWFGQLRTTMLRMGFVGSLADSSLFILKKGNGQCFVLVYLDDLVVTDSRL